MNDTIIISKTAYSNGWGSDRYKTVHGMTADERKAIREHIATVLMMGCPKSGGGNGTGTTVREVYENYGRFYHKVPSTETLKRAGLENE